MPPSTFHPRDFARYQTSKLIDVSLWDKGDIVSLKFESDAIPNSYFILVTQKWQFLENQRTALPIQL